jgi:inorganic pyrophosphatase
LQSQQWSSDLIDRGKADEKVLAVPPWVTRMPPRCMTWATCRRTISRRSSTSFRVYKDLEGTTTETRGFENAAAARGAIGRAQRLYEEKFPG